MTLLLLALACNGEGEPTEEFEGDQPGECDDGADNDADGYFDCDDSDCAGAPACQGDTGDTGLVPDDADGDGFAAEEDCNDNDASVYPGAAEVCDGVDNDCDGQKDNDPTDADTWYEDADSDGYGSTTSSMQACDKPDGYVDNDLDCDDDHRDANPEGTEVDWDGIDQNCDGYDLNIEACVAESVADAIDWVSWWSYSVSDQEEDVWVAGYELYNQTLYVDADSSQVTPSHESAVDFGVEVDSLQALNTSSDPFYLDYYIGETWYFCDGYVDWTEVPYSGDLEVLITGNQVTAQVELEATWDGYVQDDIVLWEYGSGGTCSATTLDLMADYAGYEILSFFDDGFTMNADEIADELEDEIVWYIEYNCSD